MKSVFSFSTLAFLTLGLAAQESLQHRNSYQQAYGESKAGAAVDPSKDLPRYPAVEAKDAVATWKVKPGFKLELAANEPLVRDPIAITFDENGRMFVCEMIDYSEMRDVTPHLGRISMLEDTDGDGVYDKSTVFADNLAWPTGLIWARGGLFVAATPDIWRLEDRDGDGKAEVREVAFTGFGTGLPRLNVQAMLNSLQWGQDNRVHVQSGSGNRGKISSPKRPDLPAQELATRDFWFDPTTYEFGFEAGGAQYGMSFDDFGRKFGCSNSDHLQFWVYDGGYAGQNALFSPPNPRQSIAADGGAAEVFRISPDEPWRIIRTRWRIGGVVKGVVEGGGRVSGYFTGATGTTVYRGDAYGADFVNNTFTGDAGGQLIHRKKLYPNGVSLVGKRPDDEQNVEFAASTDTWVRVVNFANAPDGTLHVCDMYREVIEHPWSIPEEIKQYLDLNSGNDRGRIYRVVPTTGSWKRRPSVALGKATSAELVSTLGHPNGWHRDTATRLLYERQDKSVVPALRDLIRTSDSAVAKLHALAALQGLGSLDAATLLVALSAPEPVVRERGIFLADQLRDVLAWTPALAEKMASLSKDRDERVRFQLAFSVQRVLAKSGLPTAVSQPLATAYADLALRDSEDPWMAAALVSGPAPVISQILFPALTRDVTLAQRAPALMTKLIELRAATAAPNDYPALLEFVSQPGTQAAWLKALGEGFKRAGTSIENVDTGKKLGVVFERAAQSVTDERATPSSRFSSMELLTVAPFARAREPLARALSMRSDERVQLAAVSALASFSDDQVAQILLKGWSAYSPKVREATLSALIAREERTRSLLEALQSGTVAPTDLSASQVQALLQQKSPEGVQKARTLLASVIPPSRQEVAAKFQGAMTQQGDALRGKTIYQGRCSVCHRAGGEGMELGPDLETVKNRGRDGLLTAILDPHKEVAPQYIAFDVATKDGNAYTGMVSRDDATSLSLKIMGGAEITLPRANIKGSSSSGKSLMPEGLEGGMSVQDMADLLTFIEQLK